MITDRQPTSLFPIVERTYPRCFINKIARVKNKKLHWRNYKGASKFLLTELQKLKKAGNTEVMFEIITSHGTPLVSKFPFYLKDLL